MLSCLPLLLLISSNYIKRLQKFHRVFQIFRKITQNARNGTFLHTDSAKWLKTPSKPSLPLMKKKLGFLPTSISMA